MTETNGKDRLVLWKALEIAIGIIISMMAWFVVQNHLMLLEDRNERAEAREQHAMEHQQMWRAIEVKADHDDVPPREVLDRFQAVEKRLERIEAKIDKL